MSPSTEVSILQTQWGRKETHGAGRKLSIERLGSYFSPQKKRTPLEPKKQPWKTKTPPSFIPGEPLQDGKNISKGRQKKHRRTPLR